MSRWVRIAMAIILGAVIVHVVSILVFPRLGTSDVWAAMDQFGPEGDFNLIPQQEPGGTVLPYLDPHMVHAVCRFALSDGPVRIVADLESEFWSAVIFDRVGAGLYSLNDRTAGRPILDLLLIGPAGLGPLQDATEILADAIIVDLPVNDGIILLRVFYRDAAILDLTRAMVGNSDCNAPIEIVPVAPVDDAADIPQPGEATPP